ncbi:MAG: hypothetical protein QOH78_2456, partial [Verrucomicrobiota bacterium]
MWHRLAVDVMPGEKEETGPDRKCRPKGRGRLVYVDRSRHEVPGIRQKPLDDFVASESLQ